MAQIHSALHAITAEIGAIEKTRRNEHFKFNFRGIDDVLGALHPLIVKHGVVILPRMTGHDHAGDMTHVYMEYEFVSVEDDSSVTVSAIGQGQDKSDKGLGKAASSAFKTLVFQQFCVPTEAAQDIEESVPAPPQKPASAPQTLSDIGAEVRGLVDVRLASLGLKDRPGRFYAEQMAKVAAERGWSIAKARETIAAWTPKDAEPMEDTDPPFDSDVTPPALPDKSVETPAQRVIRERVWASVKSLFPNANEQEQRDKIAMCCPADVKHIRDIPPDAVTEVLMSLKAMAEAEKERAA